VRCALCAVRCALCAVRCALCAVRCALCAVQKYKTKINLVSSAHCALWAVRYALCAVSNLNFFNKNKCSLLRTLGSPAVRAVRCALCSKPICLLIQFHQNQIIKLELIGASVCCARCACAKAGALVRWCAGALVRWCAGALVRWCAGALVRWCAGALSSIHVSAN
jgi:hypothetical protein